MGAAAGAAVGIGQAVLGGIGGSKAASEARKMRGYAKALHKQRFQWMRPGLEAYGDYIPHQMQAAQGMGDWTQMYRDYGTSYKGDMRDVYSGLMSIGGQDMNQVMGGGMGFQDFMGSPYHKYQMDQMTKSANAAGAAGNVSAGMLPTMNAQAQSDYIGGQYLPWAQGQAGMMNAYSNLQANRMNAFQMAGVAAGAPLNYFSGGFGMQQQQAAFNPFEATLDRLQASGESSGNLALGATEMATSAIKDQYGSMAAGLGNAYGNYAGAQDADRMMSILEDKTPEEIEAAKKAAAAAGGSSGGSNWWKNLTGFVRGAGNAVSNVAQSVGNAFNSGNQGPQQMVQQQQYRPPMTQGQYPSNWLSVAQPNLFTQGRAR